MSQALYKGMIDLGKQQAVRLSLCVALYLFSMVSIWGQMAWGWQRVDGHAFIEQSAALLLGFVVGRSGNQKVPSSQQGQDN